MGQGHDRAQSKVKSQREHHRIKVCAPEITILNARTDQDEALPLTSDPFVFTPADMLRVNEFPTHWRKYA